MTTNTMRVCWENPRVGQPEPWSQAMGHGFATRFTEELGVWFAFLRKQLVEQWPKAGGWCFIGISAVYMGSSQGNVLSDEYPMIEKTGSSHIRWFSFGSA